MVIHHYDVILERSLLRQGTLDSILDGLGTIEDGNDNGSLNVELLLAEVNLLILSSIHQCTYLAQMGRTGLLHLDLHLAIGWINVIKLFLTRSAKIEFLFGIEIFIQMKEATLATQEQTEIVETSIAIVGITIGGSILMDERRADKHQRAEIEIIAQRAFLIVNHGMTLYNTIFHLIPVCIHHNGTSIGSSSHHTLQGSCTKCDGNGLELE